MLACSLRLRHPSHCVLACTRAGAESLLAMLPVPCSLYPVPCSLFPVPCALYPVPCTLYPVPCSLFPVPCSLFPVQEVQIITDNLVPCDINGEIYTDKLKTKSWWRRFALISIPTIKSQSQTTFFHSQI